MTLELTLLRNEIAALRSVLAERDAECERLRKDAERLDLLDAYCDNVNFPVPQDRSRLPEPDVELDWFAGDGGGHVFTRGTNWREAIDRALEQFGPPSAAVAPAARETQETSDG